MSKIINNTEVEQFKKDVHRYTLRMAKEDSKIIYRGDWTREERTIMEDNGYKMVMICLVKCFQLYLKVVNFQHFQTRSFTFLFSRLFVSRSHFICNFCNCIQVNHFMNRKISNSSTRYRNHS